MVAQDASSKPAYQRLLQIIDDDRQDLVDLCIDLGGTPSPVSKERVVASKVVDWLNANGIKSWLQPLSEDSANAIGRLPGVGQGKSLIFDAHTDTGPALPPDAPERLRKMMTPWVEGDLIYGWDVVNDKAQLCAFMIAARALVKAGIRLKGDLTVAGVTFETGLPSVGEHQGFNYPGEGFGTWWMVNRGVTADYALVGETSGFGLVTVEAGELGVEVRIRGRAVYTPRLERTDSWKDNPNPTVHMAHLVLALEEWAVDYERRNTLEFEGGTIIPRAQVMSIEGGRGQAVIHVDIRLLPDANPRAVTAEVQEYLNNAGFDCEVSAFQWSRGHFAKGADLLIDSVKDAHRLVHGGEPPRPPTPETSMWRDLNMFNEVGIPSICYGPPRQQEFYSDAQDRCMKISDLVKAAQVYALTAINVCGDADA